MPEINFVDMSFSILIVVFALCLIYKTYKLVFAIISLACTWIIVLLLVFGGFYLLTYSTVWERSIGNSFLGQYISSSFNNSITIQYIQNIWGNDIQEIGREEENPFTPEGDTENNWEIFPNWDLTEGKKVVESFSVQNTSFYAIWDAFKYIYSNYLENREKDTENSSRLF